MTGILVTSPDIIRERLKHLHDIDGMTWRAIAQMPEFKGMAAGTLCSFAKGWEPKSSKLRARFGYPHKIEIEVVRDTRGRFTKK